MWRLKWLHRVSSAWELQKSLGGLESPPTLSSQVFEILAQGDVSCAWVTFIGVTSATVLVAIPETTAREVYPRPETLITGVFAPTGRAEKVDGGFQVSGHGHSNWLGKCFEFLG